MIQGDRSLLPWLSEFLNIKISNPRSLLHARTIAIPSLKYPILLYPLNDTHVHHLLTESGTKLVREPGARSGEWKKESREQGLL
jgi:hypothetical protein